MRNNPGKITLASALFAGLFSISSQAGGPLYLYDNQVPMRWDVTSPIPVYTDLGDLCDTDIEAWPFSGCLTNEQADAAVAFSFGQWTAVPSSTFQAEVAGDFSTIGLPDITGENAELIVGPDNGGGYQVMYDTDGSILRDFFGASEAVLGISSPEWAIDDVIYESWAVINVAAVPEGDDGSHVAGVMTHEFGHGINLAHSQANGQITFFGSPWYWIPWATMGCPAPYDIAPIEDFDQYMQWVNEVAIPNTETMYPLIDPQETGPAMSTVDRPEDISSLSNIYPGPGWPGNYGTVSGEIRLKDGTTGLTGVNVVVRNVADPLGDVITVLSGNLSQGEYGPDGHFTINGLTPGAQYVVYVDNIYFGGFSTPLASLPTFPEYWNGADESADATSDDPCAWSTVTAVAGSSSDTSISFNGIEGAPQFVLIPVPAATDVDSTGEVITGTYGGQLGWFYDTRTQEFEIFDSAVGPRMASDGKTVIAAKWPSVPTWEGGFFDPGLYSTEQGWQPFDMPADEPGCDGWVFVPFDITGAADKVVGLGYVNGCPYMHFNEDYTEVISVNKHWATVWDRAEGLQYLETPDFVLPDFVGCQWNLVSGCQVQGSRANAISTDGTLVAGHVVGSGYWLGAAWQDGKLIMMGADDPKGWIGSANAVNRDGSAVVGGTAGIDDYGWGLDAYIWSPEGGTTNLGHLEYSCEEVAPWLCETQSTVVFPAEGFGVTERGDLVVGRAGDYWNGFAGFLWTEATGMINFGEFLRNQGVMEAFNNDLFSPLAVSADGKTIVGWGVGLTSPVSFAVSLDQVWVCGVFGNSRLVDFPKTLGHALQRGATLGLCEKDRPIAP